MRRWFLTGVYAPHGVFMPTGMARIFCQYGRTETVAQGRPSLYIWQNNSLYSSPAVGPMVAHAIYSFTSPAISTRNPLPEDFAWMGGFIRRFSTIQTYGGFISPFCPIETFDRAGGYIHCMDPLKADGSPRQGRQSTHPNPLRTLPSFALAADGLGCPCRLATCSVLLRRA